MRPIWLELHTSCARCDAPIPVNMIANVLACPRCGTEVNVAPDVSLAQVVEGREGLVGMFGAAGSVQGRFGPADDGPGCAACGAPLDMRRAVAEGAAPCTRCGERASVRPVPEQLATKVPKGTTHVVGEAFSPTRARGGVAPTTQRFYLWGDPEAEARARVGRLRKHRRFAPLWLALGAALAGGGGYALLRGGAMLWSSLLQPGPATTLWVQFFGFLAAAFTGGVLLAHGVSRYSRGFSVVLSLVGVAAAIGCAVFLSQKGFVPWAAAGAAVGGGLGVYLIATRGPRIIV